MLALNSDRYIEFYYGCWWGGGAVNPVNIRWSAAEIAYSLDDCDTRILLVDERFKDVADELRKRSKFIVDRVKDMIVSGGENVYSAEVENALAQHPAVAISAVIGIPSEQWGEAVHAVVVLKPNMTQDIGDNEKLSKELIEHCRQVIAGYKCPRSVEFRNALPMTGAGKIQKVELRKPFWEGKDRAVN
ncbi:MAG: AMP-binding enzyme [Steroidobacter sp.]